jgi:hypothetical protein
MFKVVSSGNSSSLTLNIKPSTSYVCISIALLFMRIVIVTPLPTEENSFIASLRTQIVREAKALSYSFKEFDGNEVADNTVVIVYDRAKNSLMKEMWIRFQLKNILRKIDPDLIFQLSGNSVKEFAAKEIHFISSSVLRKENAHAAWEKFAFNNRAKVFNDHSKYIVSSQLIGSFLNTDYEVNQKRIQINAFTSSAAEVSWEEREEMKKELTGGDEYFFSDAMFAAKNEILNLLKAFSIFKKWQQSAMHLVIRTNKKHSFETELATYKYRSDIILTEDDGFLNAAYVLVQPFRDVNAAAIAKASAAKIAAITFESPDLPSTQNEIFLTVKNEPEAVGQAMISLYKNEQRRNTLANAAFETFKEYPNSIFDIINSFKG